jgi:hypothetical protein
LGAISQQRAGLDHDTEVGRLIANNTGKLRPRTKDGAELGKVSRHTAKVEPGDSRIKALKTRCLPQLTPT